MASNDVLLPGQPVTIPKTFSPIKLEGVYRSQDGLIRANILGKAEVTKDSVSIKLSRWQAPKPGSTVLGTVSRLSPLQAILSIIIVDGVPLPYGEEFTGVIRVQDVRATEKDKVKIADCFRGGDVVKGVVLSLGDSRSYLISTARNDLGVIFANSEAGATMEPVSWQEMRCPKTGKFEKRKCAKPENL